MRTDWSDVGVVLLADAGASAVWGLTGFVLARVVGRVNVVDTIWGLGFVWTTAVSVLTGAVLGAGVPLRWWILLAVVTLWGARLSWYVGTRSAGKGEDPRYADLLDGAGPHGLRAAALVFVPQSLALAVVSLPVAVGAVAAGAVGPVAWIGVAVWAVGLAFEAVGDAQMRRFKADDANHGKIADVGLWSYTRHPNYFGDATVWWGIWLVAADAWPGVLSVLGPLLMTALLAFGTGKRITERSMRDRDGWDEYARRTSGFVPMPHGLHRRLVGASRS